MLLNEKNSFDREIARLKLLAVESFVYKRKHFNEIQRNKHKMNEKENLNI